VLVGVIFAELIGPACTKYALETSGEAKVINGNEGGENLLKSKAAFVDEVREAQLVPWSWGKLQPAQKPGGTVIFGLSHKNTVGGLARMATLLAHHFQAQPVAIKVDILKHDTPRRTDSTELFNMAAREVESLG
jgi:hypothetical protein